MSLVYFMGSMVKKKAASILSLAAAVLLCSSASAALPGKGVSVSLRDKAIRDLSSRGLTVYFYLTLSNREGSERKLVRYDYRALVDQKAFFSLSVPLEEPIAVPAGKEVLLALPVRITYANLFQAVGLLEKSAALDVTGEMLFRDARNREERVSFSLNAAFPIFKEPVIEVSSLELNELTVGGADLSVRLKLHNPNSYELLIERLDFRLFFAGEEVQSGSLEGDKSLAAGIGKEFVISFLIDFFEAGEGLREAFAGPEMPCRFAGELGIASAWGWLEFPFDRSVRVPVIRKAG